MTVPVPQDAVGGRTSRSLPNGICTGAAANLLGACAGAVFFAAAPGGRFRGMEPEAVAFVGLALCAGALGLFAALPLSVYDLIRHRRWLWGTLGILSALSPVFVAGLVSNIAAAHRGLYFD